LNNRQVSLNFTSSKAKFIMLHKGIYFLPFVLFISNELLSHPEENILENILAEKAG